MNAAVRQIGELLVDTFNQRRKRCAIVECYNRHDEVYVTTTHLLQRLGYEVHLFNTWRARMKNSFVHARNLRPVVHSRLDARKVLSAVRRQGFDLVVFNTFEGREVLDCAHELLRGSSVLGFMHNGSMVRNLPDYQRFVNHPRLRLMALAPYVAQDFSSVMRANVMYPVHFYDREVPSLGRRAGVRRFCVQGYFDPGRRHYGMLLEAFATLHREGRRDFEVYVMGRSLQRRFREFAAQVRAAGLEEHVHYTWKGIAYRDYYRLLNSVDFLLPLIGPESHPTYFRSKSTSSMAAALGFNAVPVAHEQLAGFYGMEDLALTYTDNLLPALRRALALDDDQLASLRREIGATRQRLLDESQRNLQDAIASVS